MTPAAVANFLAGVAPELRGTAVVFRSDLPAGMVAFDDSLGATNGLLDLALAEYLPPSPRRPVILLNDGPLRQEADELVRGADFDRAEAEAWVFGRVALHEAGHVLRRPPPYFDAVTENARRGAGALMRLLLRRPLPEDHRPPRSG